MPLGLRSLAGPHRADVAIVGGGIAGCSAALHAAEAGARVVLVEANEIGWGASSRNAGHLPPATKHDPDEIIARYGVAAGQRLIDAAEQGPVVLAELIKRHGIDCGYALPGNHHGGPHRAGVARPCPARQLLAGARPADDGFAPPAVGIRMHHGDGHL
jgi:glycine/D-amino acid oxidase-like deaminating enzyme